MEITMEFGVYLLEYFVTDKIVAMKDRWASSNRAINQRKLKVIL